MATGFDSSRPRIYFSSNFLKNHLCVGSAPAKKRAEVVFQRRGKDISTVIYLTRKELERLAGEIFRRQEEFARQPNRTFTTVERYELWSRGGNRSSDKQRATSEVSKFHYGVKKDSDGVYVMSHFAGS